MIRDYAPTDFDRVAAMVDTGFLMSPKQVRAHLDGGRVLVYEHSTGVRGVAVMKGPRPWHDRQVADVRVYTDPACRRAGIGGQLWDALWPLVRASEVSLVFATYRRDAGDAPGFFTRRGFAPWWSGTTLRYDGPDLPEPELDWRHYEDRDFAGYLGLINVSFEPMRRENGFEPYVIFGPQSFADTDLRREMLANRDNLYVFHEEGRLVGLAELTDPVGDDGDVVDTLAVSPEARGRGLGRKITEFCINRIRDRGIRTVYIGVVDTNHTARRLYERMGCRVVQSDEEARLWLDRLNKEA